MKILSRKFVVLLALIIPVMLTSCNSKEVMKKAIEQQFVEMSNAYLKGNIPAYVDFMYPKIVERAGGRDSTIKLIEMLVQTLSSTGRQIKSINYGNISEIVKAGKELHCIVSQTLEMTRPDGTDIMETSVLAVSDDKGKSWKFLDVSGANIKALKDIFPDFNDKLQIPEKKSPTFIPNNMQKNSN
jgi:hypothetical protein